MREGSRKKHPRISLISLMGFIFLASATIQADQSRDQKFERAKLTYIRNYAWPKRLTSSDKEVLFVKKERAARPSSDPVGTSTASEKAAPSAGPAPAAPTSTTPATQPPLPPPPSENE